ncbi:hypothetical protein Q8A67_020930 [Cirrhinus molitorella]|uniref:Uncharacterized protein n=1 Tax=Cirrhinus molitorella TaxID=172907 RepID=A0AA88P639_9TELE|nr:hypothetical protein Q8A67_020930 [Cirrhinus molitorella]
MSRTDRFKVERPCTVTEIIHRRKESGGCEAGEGQKPGGVRGDHGGADSGRNQGGALAEGLGESLKPINGGETRVRGGTFALTEIVHKRKVGRGEGEGQELGGDQQHGGADNGRNQGEALSEGLVESRNPINGGDTRVSGGTSGADMPTEQGFESQRWGRWPAGPRQRWGLG